MSEEKKDQEFTERRAKTDRRNFHQSVSFPLKTAEGLVVIKDRRKTPDRRVNNISVEEAEMDDDEFSRYFEKSK